MSSFEYAAPSTVHEATRLLAQAGAMPIAGGTDLLIHTRAGYKSPQHLIDLSGLGLSYVRHADGVFVIGAMTTFAEILEAAMIQNELSCLVQAAAEIGCAQTRNLATIGGNLCSAVPSADAAPSLLALDARVKLAGRDGERVLPLNEFFVGPKRSALKPGEIMLEIQIPGPPARTGTRFLKIGRRNAMTLAVVSVAALIALDPTARAIEHVRLALGAVAPIPLRATKAENLLRGCEISDSLIERAAALAAEEITPITDLRATATYRRKVSRVLAQRALTQAAQQAKAST